MPKSTKLFIIGGLGVLLVAAAIIVVLQFSKYRDARLAGLPMRPQPSAVISSPQPFTHASVHSPLPVEVSTHSYAPIQSVELWVNGVRMGAQPPQPANALSDDALFSWNPGAPGQYTLVARVIDQNGDSADSPVVPVQVDPYTPPAGKTGTAAFDPGAPQVIPAADPGAAPQPPAPGEDAGPAKAGGPTFTDWLTDLTSQTPPKAPELLATLQGCAVTLQIHDLSNDEEGFQVYRAIGGASSWDQIATLNSQSKLQWISSTDQLAGGTQAVYYVAAVNAAGQSASNLASANPDPAACPPSQDGQNIVQLDLQNFDAGGGVGNSYCYRSTDGAHWARWPETGFLTPGKLPLDPQTARMSFDLNGLDGKPGFSKLSLTLECWGWSGGSLKFLGRVNFSDPDLSKLGLHTSGDGILHISLNTGKGNAVPFGYTKPPTDANMPFISAWLSYDPNQCKSHLPANAQNDFGAFLFCSPFPGYTIGADSANPQPYLIWAVLEHTCQAGFNDQCATLADLQADAQKWNGKVSFTLHQTSKLADDYYGLPIGRTSYVMPMQNCPSDFTATIQLNIVTSKGWAFGPESNSVTIPCTQALGDSLPVNVTFDSITLNNVQDGESDPQDVELYGLFRASTPSGFYEQRTLGNWDSSARDSGGCPNEDFFQGFNTNGLGGLGCLGSYGDGTTSLADQEMCATDTTGECWFSNTNTLTDFKMDNNTIAVNVQGGDLISLKTWIMDYDSASADDLVCQSQTVTIPRTLFQWASITPQKVALSSPDFGSGSCTVNVTISLKK